MRNRPSRDLAKRRRVIDAAVLVASLTVATGILVGVGVSRDSGGNAGGSGTDASDGMTEVFAFPPTLSDAPVEAPIGGEVQSPESPHAEPERLSPTETAHASQDPESPSPIPSPSDAATLAAEDDGSVCGLPGVQFVGTVSAAPPADWKLDGGRTTYPSSSVFGPGESHSEGYRSCFQHTPTGALFAAASALASTTDVGAVGAFAEYAISDGPFRDALLDRFAVENNPIAGVRLSVGGFQMLSYDGQTARIDLAGTAYKSTGLVTFSATFSLVWSEGDWKLNAQLSNPFTLADIPNLSGYTYWFS